MASGASRCGGTAAPTLTGGTGEAVGDTAVIVEAGNVAALADALDRVVLEMSDSAMAAGADHFGGLARDMTAAMEAYTPAELAVVHRWLEDMTAVITRHARAEPPAAPQA